MKADTRFFTCLRHAHVYAPEDLGVVDLLLAGEKLPASAKIWRHRPVLIVRKSICRGLLSCQA